MTSQSEIIFEYLEDFWAKIAMDICAGKTYIELATEYGVPKNTMKRFMRMKEGKERYV